MQSTENNTIEDEHTPYVYGAVISYVIVSTSCCLIYTACFFYVFRRADRDDDESRCCPCDLLKYGVILFLQLLYPVIMDTFYVASSTFDLISYIDQKWIGELGFDITECILFTINVTLINYFQLRLAQSAAI